MTRWFAVAALSLAAPVALARIGAADERVHVVAPGETLWQIAAARTGDALRWPELYRANRDQIADPSRLYPGQRLAIPAPAVPHRAESSPDGGRPDE